MFFISLEKDKVSCIGYNYKNLVRGLCERLKKKVKIFKNGVTTTQAMTGVIVQNLKIR